MADLTMSMGQPLPLHHFFIRPPHTDHWIELLTVSSQRLSSWSNLHENVTSRKILTDTMTWILGVSGVLSDSASNSLSSSAMGPAESTSEQAGMCNWYFWQDDPEATYRIVDPEALKEKSSKSGSRTTGSTATSSRTRNFKEQLRIRDRDQCVFTNVPNSPGRIRAQACHIIPHCKGDTYMANLSLLRADSEGNHISEIGDPRNGIMLTPSLHTALSCCDVAIYPAAQEDTILLSGNLLLLVPQDQVPAPPGITWVPEASDALPPLWLLRLVFGVSMLKNYGKATGVALMRQSWNEYKKASTGDGRHAANQTAQRSARQRNTTRSTQPESSGLATPGTQHAWTGRHRTHKDTEQEPDLLDLMLAFSEAMRQDQYDRLTQEQKEAIAEKARIKEQEAVRKEESEQQERQSRILGWLTDQDQDKP